MPSKTTKGYVISNPEDRRGVGCMFVMVVIIIGYVVGVFLASNQ